MIDAYMWGEYRILLTVLNRQQKSSFLLNHVTQEQFMEHWMEMWEENRDRKILDISLVTLTEESFELLEPLYDGNYLLE